MERRNLLVQRIQELVIGQKMVDPIRCRSDNKVPLIRSRRTAARTTTGIATVSGAALAAAAMTRAPNPTWDKPSPIMEYRFSTRLTPRRAEQSDTIVPTSMALTING